MSITKEKIRGGGGCLTCSHKTNITVPCITEGVAVSEQGGGGAVTGRTRELSLRVEEVEEEVGGDVVGEEVEVVVEVYMSLTKRRRLSSNGRIVIVIVVVSV